MNACSLFGVINPPSFLWIDSGFVLCGWMDTSSINTSKKLGTNLSIGKPYRLNLTNFPVQMQLCWSCSNLWRVGNQRGLFKVKEYLFLTLERYWRCVGTMGVTRVCITFFWSRFFWSTIGATFWFAVRGLERSVSEISKTPWKVVQPPCVFKCCWVIVVGDILPNPSLCFFRNGFQRVWEVLPLVT